MGPEMRKALNCLGCSGCSVGAAAKAAQKRVLIPQRLMRGSQASCTVLTQRLGGALSGGEEGARRACSLPFLGPCPEQVQGGYPAGAYPGLGAPVMISPR